MEKKLQINTKMNRFCLALDLVNDPILIDQYIKHHNNVWPEIIDSIKDSGILDMQIFHVADRLFMIIEVQDGLALRRKIKWMVKILMLLNGRS